MKNVTTLQLIWNGGSINKEKNANFIMKSLEFQVTVLWLLLGIKSMKHLTSRNFDKNHDEDSTNILLKKPHMTIATPLRTQENSNKTSHWLLLNI